MSCEAQAGATGTNLGVISLRVSKRPVPVGEVQRDEETDFQKQGEIKDTQALLRHTTAATTLKHYQKTLEESLIRGVQNWDTGLRSNPSRRATLQGRTTRSERQFIRMTRLYASEADIDPVLIRHGTSYTRKLLKVVGATGIEPVTLSLEG
jgi:hypothetical protein